MNRSDTVSRVEQTQFELSESNARIADLVADLEIERGVNTGLRYKLVALETHMHVVDFSE